MLQNPCKTLGFKKNMVYKIPLGEVNHIQPVAYVVLTLSSNYISLVSTCKTSHFGRFKCIVYTSLCAQLLPQLYPNPFETLQVSCA